MRQASRFNSEFPIRHRQAADELFLFTRHRVQFDLEGDV